MLPWEQQIGYGVAGVGAAGGVLEGIANHNGLAAGLSIGAAVLLLLGVRHGQRVVAALAGLPSVVVAQFIPIQLIMMGYVFYLIMRTSNGQSKLRRSQPRLSAADRRAAAEARIAEKKAKRKGLPPPSAAKRPPANKRYTPPKPKRTPPPKPVDRSSKEQ